MLFLLLAYNNDVLRSQAQVLGVSGPNPCSAWVIIMNPLFCLVAAVMSYTY